MEHAISLLQVVMTCAPLGKSVRSSTASLAGTCHATTQRCGFSQMLIYIALLLLARDFRSVVRSIYHPSRHDTRTTRSDLYKMLLPSVELATGNKSVAATQAGAVHDNSDHFSNFTNSQLSHPARPQNGGTENEKQPTPLERNKTTRSLPLIV